MSTLTVQISTKPFVDPVLYIQISALFDLDDSILHCFMCGGKPISIFRQLPLKLPNIKSCVAPWSHKNLSLLFFCEVFPLKLRPYMLLKQIHDLIVGKRPRIGLIRYVK